MYVKSKIQDGLWKRVDLRNSHRRVPNRVCHKAKAKRFLYSASYVGTLISRTLQSQEVVEMLSCRTGRHFGTAQSMV